MSSPAVTTTAPMLSWKRVAFPDLTPFQLYELLQLRTDVFVMEQECAFQDMDGTDHLAVHLLGTVSMPGHGEQLIAYARLFPAGIKFSEASIGRVATRPSARGSGLGHALFAESMRGLCHHWGTQPIRIWAQAHLKSYYAHHGFADVGKPYLEDGIPHLEMLWTPPHKELN